MATSPRIFSRKPKNWRRDDGRGRREPTTISAQVSEGHNLSNEDIKEGMRIRTIKKPDVPMLCGSRNQKQGRQAMLDALLDYLLRRGHSAGSRAGRGRQDQQRGNRRRRSPSRRSRFKIMTDPTGPAHVFFRVTNGSSIRRHRLHLGARPQRTYRASHACRCSQAEARRDKASAGAGRHRKAPLPDRNAPPE